MLWARCCHLPLHQLGLHPLTTGVPGSPTGGPVHGVHAVDLPVWVSPLSGGD